MRVLWRVLPGSLSPPCRAEPGSNAKAIKTDQATHTPAKWQNSRSKRNCKPITADLGPREAEAREAEANQAAIRRLEGEVSRLLGDVGALDGALKEKDGQLRRMQEAAGQADRDCHAAMSDVQVRGGLESPSLLQVTKSACRQAHDRAIAFATWPCLACRNSGCVFRYGELQALSHMHRQSYAASMLWSVLQMYYVAMKLKSACVLTS
jgi:hypothetical protein